MYNGIIPVEHLDGVLSGLMLTIGQTNCFISLSCYYCGCSNISKVMIWVFHNPSLFFKQIIIQIQFVFNVIGYILYFSCSPLFLFSFQIEEITFKNYYTAYVTLRLLRKIPGQEAPAKWTTALRDLPLMDNPHTERGSQDYFSVHRTQVGQTYCHLSVCLDWFVFLKRSFQNLCVLIALYSRLH